MLISSLFLYLSLDSLDLAADFDVDAAVAEAAAADDDDDDDSDFFSLFSFSVFLMPCYNFLNKKSYNIEFYRKKN